MAIDLHSGAMGGEALAAAFFSNTTKSLGAGAINCETNAGIHTMRRALPSTS